MQAQPENSLGRKPSGTIIAGLLPQKCETTRMREFKLLEGNICQYLSQETPQRESPSLRKGVSEGISSLDARSLESLWAGLHTRENELFASWLRKISSISIGTVSVSIGEKETRIYVSESLPAVAEFLGERKIFPNGQLGSLKDGEKLSLPGKDGFECAIKAAKGHFYVYQVERKFGFKEFSIYPRCLGVAGEATLGVRKALGKIAALRKEISAAHAKIGSGAQLAENVISSNFGDLVRFASNWIRRATQGKETSPFEHNAA